MDNEIPVVGQNILTFSLKVHFYNLGTKISKYIGM